jgi:hypothetical protein
MVDKDKKADTFEGGLVPSVPRHEEAPEPVAEVSVPTNVEGATPETVEGIIEKALRARDAEVSALREELNQVKAGQGQESGLLDGQASVGGYPWMFWRKPQTWPDATSRGWIVCLPGGPTPNGNRDAGSYTLYLKKGFIPITKYGYVEPPKVPEGVVQFYPLFRAGGAKEFVASQVIAHKWHVNPPLPGLKFPQYEAIKDTIINFVCEACGHTLFFMPEDRGLAGEAYRGHLMSAHKYPFREAAEAVKNAGLTVRAYAAPVASGATA